MSRIDGVMNLNKPAGLTSRQVVNIVQRLARPAKVGHAGTLDPLATGVLVVCVGSATRLIEYVQRMPKRYHGTFLLGRFSTTEDIEGEVTELADPPQPSPTAVEDATRQFVGCIQQRPPAYSALKIEGRRAYKLARRGEAVELKPRPITIHSMDIVRYDYPELVLDIACGSGTYVRSLGRDLAEALGTAAVMSALERTAIGNFRVDEALDPGTLTDATWADHVQPPIRAVDALPRIELTDEEMSLVANGRTIEKDFSDARNDFPTCNGLPGGNDDVRGRAAAPSSPTSDSGNQFAGVNAHGQLVAVLAPRGPGLLRPLRVMPPPS